MKISQLCKESGFKKSAIHHYLNIGLLSPPRRVGLNLFIYDETHLAQLRQIRQFKEEEKLPLGIIKEILNQGEAPLKTLTAEIKERAQADQKREHILKTATELFSQKGYDKTKISDIADSLHMSRGTFYFYFKDKRELFIECIENLTLVIVPQEYWEDIRKERDITRRQRVRALAFLKAFPGFRGILNLLRQTMAGDDPVLSQKAMETLRAIIQPLAKESRRAMRYGVFREFDEELVGYFLLIVSEMMAFRLMMDDRYTIEDGLNLIFDFIYNGILARETEGPEKNKPGLISGRITDQKGVTTLLSDIRFDGKSDLLGHLGEAEVNLELDNIDSFIIRRDNAKYLLEIIMKDGQDVILEMKGDILVSGQAPFGKFTVPLKGISTVTFIENG